MWDLGPEEARLMPLYLAAQSNAMRILFGFREWYTPWWLVRQVPYFTTYFPIKVRDLFCVPIADNIVHLSRMILTKIALLMHLIFIASSFLNAIVRLSGKLKFLRRTGKPIWKVPSSVLEHDASIWTHHITSSTDGPLSSVVNIPLIFSHSSVAHMLFTLGLMIYPPQLRIQPYLVFTANGPPFWLFTTCKGSIAKAVLLQKKLNRSSTSPSISGISTPLSSRYWNLSNLICVW